MMAVFSETKDSRFELIGFEAILVYSAGGSSSTAMGVPYRNP
jgi:hypothetical protein